MNEQSILEIAADGVARDGYVEYGAFYGLRPVDQGNKFLFFVRSCLLASGYEIHMRRDAAEWTCGYLGDNTHFHRD